MAAAIMIKGIATSTLGDGYVGEVELVVADSGVEIPAVFSIDISSGETTIPMCGITPYGRLTFYIADTSEEGNISVDVTGTPKDGSTAVVVTTTLGDLLSKVTGEALETE